MYTLGKTITGAQSLFRALDILKLIAQHHNAGIDLPSLVRLSGIQRTTVYRLATALTQAGFVEREADGEKRYRLGIHSMQLGLTAMIRPPLLEACKPAMKAISRQTGAASYLVVRNGDYGHCLHKIDGKVPIKTPMIVEGSLRLLGLGTGGQTILSLLSDEEIDKLYLRHAQEYERRGMSRLGLNQAVARVRRNQVAETQDLITTGMAGVGVAFEVIEGDYAAISVAEIKSRMTPEHAKWISKVIRTELEKVGFVQAFRSA